MEGSPFGQRIVEFIYALIQRYKTQEVSSLVEALSKISTREAARIILTLLTKFNLNIVENILVSGLARIGDPAISQALEWSEKGELSEPQIFEILVACETPFAT